VVAALRWLTLLGVTSSAMILLSQIMHAVTYGTFHMASILYIDVLIPEKSKTLGQAVNNALTYGLGMMVGFFINGYFFETMGSFKLFGLSSLIALFGGAIFGLFLFRVRRSKVSVATKF
jgi:PPP family 3-phenylpropionic acid transporter